MEDKNKKIISIACVVAFIILVILSILLVNSKTYSIRIVDDEYEYVEVVKRNHKLQEPEEPEKEGYVFIGWFKGSELYDFDLKVKEDFTLRAKYEKELDDEEETEDVFEEIEDTTTTTTTTSSSTTTTTKPVDKTTKTTEKTTKQTTSVTTKPTSSKTTSKTTTSTTKPTTKTTTTTTKTTTSTTTTTKTTTKAVTYSVVRVDAAGSVIAQEVIYVKNNSTGKYVSGTVTITFVGGKTETVSIPASGKVYAKSAIVSITNPKGN